MKLSLTLPSLFPEPAMRAIENVRATVRDIDYEIVVVSPFEVSGPDIRWVKEETLLSGIVASDATLIERDGRVWMFATVRDGNAGAFEELVLRYQNRLLTILEHLVGNREQAEDLTQEVFLRVFRARARYEPGAKFSTWLFTIANNVASNARRSYARRKEACAAGQHSASCAHSH